MPRWSQRWQPWWFQFHITRSRWRFHPWCCTKLGHRRKCEPVHGAPLFFLRSELEEELRERSIQDSFSFSKEIGVDHLWVVLVDSKLVRLVLNWWLIEIVSFYLRVNWREDMVSDIEANFFLSLSSFKRQLLLRSRRELISQWTLYDIEVLRFQQIHIFWTNSPVLRLPMAWWSFMLLG